MKYYQYLQNKLTFPFKASYEREIGPFSVEEYDINCIRLDQEMQVEDMYGIWWNVDKEEGNHSSG